ncbi:hypothetical protein R3I93_013180 [Phoxinus phoxinus]|uniref:Disease resistance R13L4/SHOC-2-like LRR domain-containing protein n=1 Tax=Phoxinus phoxinus TaxID=58324 RepID=A0AAN9CTS8_9TELE
MIDYDHESVDCAERAVMLHMRRRGLKSISDSVLQMTHLQSLSLEGNAIRGLPERFFGSLPALLWLDVRNNQISALPAAVGQHMCLKTFLLEGNPITALPPELGNLTSLKALSLRNCPLTFPPRDVLDLGLPNILQYLRCAQLGEEAEVERLCFSSLDVCEEDDPDIQIFQELRHRIILMERNDLHTNTRSRVQHLLNGQREGRVTQKDLEEEEDSRSTSLSSSST